MACGTITQVGKPSCGWVDLTRKTPYAGRNELYVGRLDTETSLRPEGLSILEDKAHRSLT